MTNFPIIMQIIISFIDEYCILFVTINSFVTLKFQSIIFKIKKKLCEESKSTYSHGLTVICFLNVLFKLYSLMFKRTNTKEDLKLSLVALNSQDFVL